MHVAIAGDSGAQWSVVREAGRWRLYAGRAAEAGARVRLDESTAWRLFTKGLTPEQAERVARLEGDRALGRQVLRAVAIIG